MASISSCLLARTSSWGPRQMFFCHGTLDETPGKVRQLVLDVHRYSIGLAFASVAKFDIVRMSYRCVRKLPTVYPPPVWRGALLIAQGNCQFVKGMSLHNSFKAVMNTVNGGKVLQSERAGPTWRATWRLSIFNRSEIEKQGLIDPDVAWYSSLNQPLMPLGVYDTCKMISPEEHADQDGWMRRLLPFCNLTERKSQFFTSGWWKQFHVLNVVWMLKLTKKIPSVKENGLDNLLRLFSSDTDFEGTS